MKPWTHIVMHTDRRMIFALVGLAVFFPLLYGPFKLPVKATPVVQRVYDKIESLPERSVFLISLDFDPSSKPELYPMAIAIVRHAFRKNLRVLAMNLWITGTTMAEQIVSAVAKEYGREYGKDYVYLGWAPGNQSVILGIGQDLYKTFPSDYYGTDTPTMAVLQGVRSLRDVDYLFDVAAGDPGIETWIVYGREKYRFEMGGGCTAVSAPGMYMYVNSGQINGLLGGMRGAAEYETLIGQSDKATVGMDAQSVTHLLIVVLVVISNVVYVITRKSSSRSA